MQDFRKLLVWQKAHELALLTYRITADFPKDEIFGLRHVMRKTSVDIPAFIAEGCGKFNDVEFSRCMASAIGLSNRLEYYALMAFDLAFFSDQIHQSYEANLIESRKIMSGFNRRLVT